MKSEIHSETNIERIAMVCHEANRAWCHANGDVSQVPWADAADWQRKSAIAGVRYSLEHPNAPDSAQHDQWMADKLRDGWVYGPVKDAAAKIHPTLVPFAELPWEQHVKDKLFMAVVRALAPVQ